MAYSKKLSQQQIVKDLKETAGRIANYCKLYEIDNYRTHGFPIYDNGVYSQQRAKLTAYLYFLQLLGEEEFGNRILKERGFYMVDTKAGVYAEKLPYLKKIKILERKQKESFWKRLWQQGSKKKQ